LQIFLLIKNNYFIVSSENKDILETILETLSFWDSSKAYSMGRFDKNLIRKVTFAKWVEDLGMPSIKVTIGFLQFVESVLEDYDYKVIDDREELKEPTGQDSSLKDIELYDHQKSAIKKAINNRRGLIISPTGSGKTEIFLAMIKMLDESTLVVFNRAQLTRQTMERAVGRGIDAGIVQGNNVLEKTVTMATIQSIEKLEDIRKYKNLIIDEVHNASSKSFQNILKEKHWNRVYGFSATAVNPSKMDLKTAKIISNIGPVIFKADSKKLMENGIIAKPTIYMIKINRPDNIEDLGYRTAEKTGIIYNKHRNKIVKGLCDIHEKDKILIMTKYVDQGKEIQKLLPGVEFIWNETKIERRMELIEKFERSDITTLIASRILDEGIDIKDFNVLIIASAGATFRKTIQRLGRGLRITENKKTVTVYDFLDDTHKSLYKHSKQRMKDYKIFGYDDIRTLEDLD
jgi:DNA excision repair protein ERCC-3